ncbi:hypothetical protein ACFPIJ_31730 [Dactylosporangium cerinum]|uniref:Uncharacterized protein n=1 Tax=Dactylosporangium cerinum TaxID=1434730 RepID=A0ABV9W267_9ACTN
MTEPMSRVDAMLARLGKHDPFSEALCAGLTLPAPTVVRMRFVVELVAHLHDSLTDSPGHGAGGVSDLRAGRLDAQRLPPRGEAAMTDDHGRLPVRFVDAEQVNPFHVLMTRQVRTHAVLGETLDCERLLIDAERAMSRADEEPTPSWAEHFDQAEYFAQVAACYLLLRRHQATGHWLTQSLALQPKERSRDRATYLIWRADTVYNLGDIEHAGELVGQAVTDIAARDAFGRRLRRWWLGDPGPELVWVRPRRILAQSPGASGHQPVGAAGGRATPRVRSGRSLTLPLRRSLPQ